MTQADVCLPHLSATGVGRRCPHEPERRSAALLLNHFDLAQRQPAHPPRTQCFEESLLRREPDGERLHAVGSLRAVGSLGGGVDPLLEPGTVRGERPRDSFRLHHVEPHSQDHHALLDPLADGKAPCH